MRKSVFAISITILIFLACSPSQQQFKSLDSSSTGITFNNVIDELEEVNILNYEYVYNGGGVAIGDLNGDNLQDIVFSGNMVENAVYLNKGNLRFEDVSEASGIRSASRWSTGLTLVDINADGLLDIYICSSGHKGVTDMSNLLFINQSSATLGVEFEGL